ncbi:MAG: hypothetical protein IJ642_03920 [Oscillospiraceae bacterium]|nr:hypothetical protein [Oscillospiraceae bacterium]
MKRYFLVDFEHLQHRNVCLNGIENLTEADKVYILFSGEDSGVSFSMMEKINASKAQIFRKYVSKDVNEDAMQYAIGFYMGYIRAREENNNNYALAIISDEKFGFLPKLEDINLYACQTISKAVSVMPQEDIDSGSEWEKKFSEIMDGLGIGKNLETEVHKALNKARETADSVARAAYTQAKVNDLLKGVPQDLADNVYNALKPLLDPENDNKDNKK